MAGSGETFDRGAPPSAVASVIALLAFVALCLLAGFLGSYATTPNIPGWYATLQKPPLTPPNSVFPVVWTLLYLAMAVAAWLVWRATDGTERRRRLVPFFVQLALNILWSFAFFGLQSPLAGLVVIVLLLAAIVWTIAAFRTASPAAALLLLPYLCWVAFASYLDLGILVLNG